jgi:hypothetical protein
MWTFATVAIAGALGAALVWVPMTGMWWHLLRWAYYLLILMWGARHGPLSGLFAGVAASLLWTIAAATRGMGEMAWLNILTPDFAAVGLLGGTFSKVWPRFRHVYSAGRVDAWPALGPTFEPELNVDLNPLASIQSAAGLLSEDDTPTEFRQELCGIIATECKRLSASITSLHQRSPAAAQPQVHEANITAIIDAAAREGEFVLCGRGATLRTEIAPDLPPIQCDPDQIRNLIMSLIINAVQLELPGDEVVLNAHCGNDGVVLDVRDLGNRSFVSRIVKRFFRSQRATTRVGFAAAYDIVRQHGGKIEAKLNVRKGLEVSVWLPLRRNCTNGSWKGAGGGGR